jgi:hypothetical protein
MKFSRFPIFFYAFISFLLINLSSCDDPYKVGLELPNATLLNTTYADTFSVSSSLVLQANIYNTDAFATGSDRFGNLADNRYATASLGYIYDSQFGATKASFYTKIPWTTRWASFDSVSTVGTVSTRFAPASYDSARIKLSWLGIIGDTLTPLTIKVEQLVSKLDTTKKYDSKQNLPVMREIGRATVIPKTIKGITQPIYIYLTNEFMSEVFAKSNKTDFSNSNSFDNFMKGFKFSIEGASPAYMLSVNMLGNTNIEFIPKYTSGSNIVYPYYFITSSLIDANRNQWFTSVESNYENTQFLNKLTPYVPVSTKNTNNRIYLQDGTGLIALLDFPSLRGYNKKVSQDDAIVLNRAELYISAVDNDNNTSTPDLFFYQAGQNGVTMKYNELPIFDFDISRRIDATPVPIARDVAVVSPIYPLYASYVKSAKNYNNVFFTRYLQSVIDGKDTLNGQGKGIFMIPGSLETNSNGSYVKHNIRLNKVILADNNAANGDKKLKLRLYYTKFKKR